MLWNAEEKTVDENIYVWFFFFIINNYYVKNVTIDNNNDNENDTDGDYIIQDKYLCAHFICMLHSKDRGAKGSWLAVEFWMCRQMHCTSRSLARVISLTSSSWKNGHCGIDNYLVTILVERFWHYKSQN